MRKKMIFASLAGALALTLPVQPTLAQKKAAAAPTKADIESAKETLGLLMAALNSKDVPSETKDGLFGCIYQNSLHRIAKGQQEVLAKNPKLDRKNANLRLLVIAKVCGAPVPKPTAKKGS